MILVNLKENNIRLKHLLLFLGTYFASIFVLKRVFVFVINTLKMGNPQMLVDYFNLTVSALSLSLILYFIYRFKLNIFKRSKSETNSLNLIKVMVYTYAMLFLPSAILLFFNNVDSTGAVTTGNQEIITNALTMSSLIPMFLGSVVFAPILEELLFRAPFVYFKSRYEPFNSKWGIVVRIVISSLFFGFMHNPNNLVEVLSYASSGVMLGLIVATTNRIEYAIGIHALNNMIGFMTIIYSM